MRSLTPGAIRDTRPESSRPALALIGGRAGNALRFEATHPCGRIEYGAAYQTGVDDDPHPLDRQAGFGDVGGEYYFACAGRRRAQRSVLLFARQLTEERQHAHRLVDCSL